MTLYAAFGLSAIISVLLSIVYFSVKKVLRRIFKPKLVEVAEGW
jgi:hypothetical protein